MAILDTVREVVGELSTWTFSTVLSVPDAGIERPPLLTEMDAVELSVFVADTGTYITAWTFGAGTWAVGVEVLKNINVKNTGRGVYVEATGTLTITLHAGDNPCVATGTTEGDLEMHEALVTTRYNGDVDQLHKRVRFQVQNLGKVPRVP